MSDYCYPGTGVLINKLNIRDNDVLYQAERDFTSLRLKELLSHPVSGNFDLLHLRKIHKHLFQDIYIRGPEK